MHKEAKTSLYGTEDDKKFNLDPEGLLSFLDLVDRRAKAQGWGMMTVPDSAGDNHNIISEHGKLTVEEISAHVTTMLAGGVNRLAQEDEQLYQCLMNSITIEAQNTVNLKRDKFMVSNEGSGLALLKIIITEAQLDTKATVTRLQGQLTSGMSQIMASQGNNIKAFNQEIKSIVRKLAQRGHPPGDLLPQLMLTYKDCEAKDSPFYRYMENLNNNYNDGHLALTADDLMLKAENKYKELLEDQQCNGKPKPNTIVALESQIADLTKIIKENTTVDPEKTPTRRNRKPPAWVNKPPAEGKPREKKVNGEVWYFCEGGPHGKFGGHKPKWVKHHPDKCDAQKAPDAETVELQPPKSESSKEQATKKRVGWSTAMLSKITNQE